MLDRQQKAAVRQLLQSPQWQIVEEIIKESRRSIMERPALRDSQWETLKETIRKEAMIEGMSLLLQELYKVASEE